MSKGKICLAIIAIIVIGYVIYANLPRQQPIKSFGNPQSVVFDPLSPSQAQIPNVNVLFLKYGMNQPIGAQIQTDATGSFTLMTTVTSGDMCIIRLTKVGYYQNQIQWVAPATDQYGLFPIAPLPLNRYSTSFIMFVRDSQGVTNIDNSTYINANLPTLNIGSRTLITIALQINNQVLNSSVGCNFYDYINQIDRHTILSMFVQDSNSSNRANYEALQVSGWTKGTGLGYGVKQIYATEIQPIEYTQDNHGTVIKNGLLYLTVNLDVSLCTKLLSGKPVGSGIKISIGLHDMTNTYDFLNNPNADPSQVCGSGESYLSFELVK